MRGPIEDIWGEEDRLEGACESVPGWEGIKVHEFGPPTFYGWSGDAR